jgi:pyruvate/2-oxoacid:ferredoxin oxidoreductase beta subunit/NAD-dependent dihydropyrimidine dehydrogenase PreA subunit
MEGLLNMHVDDEIRRLSERLLDLEGFREAVLEPYARGTAERELPADALHALSWLPPGTACYRDFSAVAPDLPALDAEKCVGCMECVTQCPDSAILAKVVPAATWQAQLEPLKDDPHAAFIAAQAAKTTKYFDVPVRKGHEGGMFVLVTDPSKCKGCGECVTACGEHRALAMVPKNEARLAAYRAAVRFFRKLPPTPRAYIQDKVLADMMLAPAALLYCGGAASCMGCGEATVIRMMLAATGFVHGAQSLGIVAATGCNTVFGSTYPYNPYQVPWTNSLFENAPAVAMGIRAAWDRQGLRDKRLWVIGGDGAMLDIGFQSLSRLLMSGMDIKVLVLDTQVYSNTGGQSSTASFRAQDSKMSAYGRSRHGKHERRKELAQIVMMHPDVFVAQTTAAHLNHFYRAVIEANAYPGPAVVIAYAPCQPEHGIGDDAAVRQAKLAVDSRAFPLLVYDPRAGERLEERLSLQGNPARKEDWYVTPKGEVIDFIYFARTEGRFAKHFDPDGRPSAALLAAQEDRLRNWRLLQELAGLR